MNNFFQGYDDDDDDEALILAHESRIVRCRTCRAKIIWFETAAGKMMPVDSDTVEPADEKYDTAKHISHFATCPDHAKHRKPRTPRTPVHHAKKK